MSEDNERKVCVILPISDDKSLRSNYSRSSSGSTAGTIDHNINFESSIESTCFAKPLIVFTIKALKRISCIDTIILCSTSSRQEQIQEIISEHLPNYEGLKYLCASTTLPKNGHKNNTTNHHDITLNKLLKHCCSFLNEINDIVIVHDPNMPCIDEKIIDDLCLEAFKHGAACLSTAENISNPLVKIDDSNIEEEQAELGTRKDILRSTSVSGALVSDFLDLNYRICFKPQAFKYSIFLIIFENCSKEELEDDIDCLKLAKTHADIRAKLVFEKDHVSNYPKNICCIQRYLKEIHKQAIIIAKRKDQDVCYLQNILRFEKWNVEICHSLEKETFLKMNEMLASQALPDGIVLIRFCESINDIKEFEFNFESASEEATECEKTKSDTKSCKRLTDSSSNYVLFMIKTDSISSPVNTTPQDAIRSALKQNLSVQKIWHITILYESLNLNTAELINYTLTDRHQAINGQIFECME